MLPTTWTALLLLALAVLPGATFTFALERQAGLYGVALADRLLRFVAASLVFDAVYAWPAYAAYRAWFAGEPFGGGQFAAAWSGAVVAAVVPAVAGTLLGVLYATRRSRSGAAWARRLLPPAREARLLRALLGRAPEPRAWDFVFSAAKPAYLRVRTTDGSWIGGRFAGASYAGGYPDAADLLIEEAWPIDADGAFGDASLGYPVYVPAATIAYVEVLGDHTEEVRTDA